MRHQLAPWLSSLLLHFTQNITVCLEVYGNHRIRQIDCSGTVSRLAGRTSYTPVTTGPALEAYLYDPRDLTLVDNAIYLILDFPIYKLEYNLLKPL